MSGNVRWNPESQLDKPHTDVLRVSYRVFWTTIQAILLERRAHAPNENDVSFISNGRGSGYVAPRVTIMLLLLLPGNMRPTNRTCGVTSPGPLVANDIGGQYQQT